MSAKTKRPNTIKYMGKKIANNGDENDYSKTPIGADSDNVDRPDNSTVEESLVKIETEKVEIIPVEALPESNIKVYPYIYALVKPSESKGILYEYKNDRWINYSNGAKGIWVGTKEECVKDFNNIESGTIVIIIKKKSDSGETHTHDYVCQITKEPTYSQSGIKTYTCFLCGDTYTEEIPALIDSINPAGVIRIGDNEYATWKDTISFDSYYKDDQTVTIEATDNETGVKEISYYLSNTAINDSSIGTVTWTSYTDPFTIQPNDNYIVYARITDNADNVTYICSDGIVMDNIPPVFEGLEDGGIYPAGTVLTVEEGATLSVNDEVVELVNNSYTFTEPMDNIRLSLTDRAGNSFSIIVNINCAHDFVDGVCSICGKNEYEDYVLSFDNYSMCGITQEGDVVIPETFEYEGQKYRTVGIDKNTFSYCDTLLSVHIPKTVCSIGNAAFFKCTSLTNINIPEGIKAIGRNTFAYCTALTNINIPEGVESIDDSAFSYCLGITSINIPSSVTNLSFYTFAGCDNLKNMYYDSNSPIMDIDHDFGEHLTLTISKNIEILFSNLREFKGNIIIEEGSKITTISSNLFNRAYFKSISLPSSINRIEDGAFMYSQIEKITIPANVLYWGNSTFDSCYKLRSVIVSDGISKIPDGTFSGCTKLESVSIPASIVEIGNGAFYNCTSLNVEVPNNVSKIGSSTFGNVPHITYHGSATGSPWGALAIN